MMAARKLDGEDPNIVFMLRCIYGGVQAIAVLVALFIYMKASAAASDTGNAVKIYVPPPPQVSSVIDLYFQILLLGYMFMSPLEMTTAITTLSHNI